MSQGPTIHSIRVLRQMDHLIMALKVDVAAERPDVHGYAPFAGNSPQFFIGNALAALPLGHRLGLCDVR